ncbi:MULTISPECIES: hypothetical protein [unclassified Coleofasciculus]|uniref:hypothetical protein n=1 Tax=Cyanophyceae TaxID=3028117 RepID=UPI0016874D75|nr:MULTISPECIES: hypothetical protein [unclassified Coleofasciculus]MBD1838922.1 hypothetical protein [Coleofasciculus sp. FACHB-501]MBD1880314.1 hypothetical protein [Coleofasciculus sp. FACHB-T130]MBD1895735.1 hypothetical protein [Coleofasciculus sp. FACHB-129]MBD1901295.1 hypothetical protein [Coleofasciculus sp. FACHB-125]MBD1944738.1 hypothetical protein [Coleofasciculus sp. FACHB-712]
MQTLPNKKQPSTAENATSATPEIWLSLATVPMLLGVLGIKAVSELLCAIGQNSEEVFRGDRLPVLHVPTPGNTSQEGENEEE